MKKILSSALLILLFFSGCSFKAGYDPSYVQNLRTTFNTPKNSTLKLAVLTTNEYDNKLLRQSPTSFTGGGTTLEIPIGIITRELTYEYFAHYYSDISRIKSMNGEYSIIISPEITHFEYEYDQLSNLGFAITPKLSFTLKVQVYNHQNLVMDKLYDSGLQSGASYMVSGQPGEHINKLLHETLFHTLSQVKLDIDKIVETPLNP
ncbi:MAG: hypothetical protein PHW64_08230 [Sulfuricurvum sp.]|nr:hypothetical protein [Sulfuricurvum sp.]